MLGLLSLILLVTPPPSAALLIHSSHKAMTMLHFESPTLSEIYFIGGLIRQKGVIYPVCTSLGVFPALVNFPALKSETYLLKHPADLKMQSDRIFIDIVRGSLKKVTIFFF